MSRTYRLGAAAVAAIAFFTATPAAAQDGYREPPAPIAQILDAPRLPSGSPSPDGRWLLLLEEAALPSIADVAEPWLGLAGTRFHPRTNTPTWGASYRGLVLRSVDGAVERRIETPDGASVRNVAWSPDAQRVSFAVVVANGLELWVSDVETGRARRVTGPVLTAVASREPCGWLPDSRALLCFTVPAGRGGPPAPPPVPPGPIVQQTDGEAAPSWTIQNLLRSPADEAAFDYHFTSQLARIALDGQVAPLGRPDVHVGARFSPDARYLLVQTVHRPYSYTVALGNFPRRTEVWDAAGTLVKQIADIPLQERVVTGRGEAIEGIRSVGWRADAPATLVWAEALDGGDPDRPAAARDRLFLLDAPFTGDPVAIGDFEYRLNAGFVDGALAIHWARPDLALVSESWWRTRMTRTWAVDPSRPGSQPRLLHERSSEDRYADPGSFVTTTNAQGFAVPLLSVDGRSAFLSGRGASPEGDRPFLDRIDLVSGTSTRLWRSASPHYEEAVAVLDDGRRAVTRRESVSEPPNYFVRDLRRNRLTQLTSFADPAPQLAGLTSELITYAREDGVQLSATLYLPPGYDRSQGPLPFLFWAYPREFKSAADASQVQGSPYRFARPGAFNDHLFVLTQGYGVLDGPAMPIIGEGEKEPNDTYVEQLVASARAAVDKVVSLGVADRERIAVGGHSYGAFMTANLLAHSDLFAAGVARSGAFNRTLTPFGFQSEMRTYWQARDVYSRMSPFMHADRIRTPILIIHGADDSNSGTYPIQSERLYAALKGHGAVARLVMLPAEDHGYRARQSVGHVLWETVTWLDAYVKRAARPRAEGSIDDRP